MAEDMVTLTVERRVVSALVTGASMSLGLVRKAVRTASTEQERWVHIQKERMILEAIRAVCKAVPVELEG